MTSINKKKVTTLAPINFSFSYKQATNTVTLTVSGKNPFTKGQGLIKIADSGRNGVSSQVGVLLNPKYATFPIPENG